MDVEESFPLRFYALRPNMTRERKIRFPFDRDDTNERRNGRFADPATVEGEKVKESEKEREKEKRNAEGGERGVDWQMPANV